MYIRTIKLEKSGLKDFWNEERACQEQDRQRWWNQSLPFKWYPECSAVNEEDIETYEGGTRNSG